MNDENCVVTTAALGELGGYRFTVIFARYQDKWLYCRAKERTGFETAGGHIEPGETTLECAKRELYEETGAARFDLYPAFDYSVRFSASMESNTGQVFFAKVYELGEMPDFEMAEVPLLDGIPEEMRFPRILPVLYERMRLWLYGQKSDNELWDVYDAERNLLGKTHRRGDPMPAGEYHLVVVAALQNSAGAFLITKRAPNKRHPNVWECTAGSAVAGDGSLAAAIREAKEETGLDLKPEDGKLICSLRRKHSFEDVWLFRQDFDLNGVVLQEFETVDAKYASKAEIREMIQNGTFAETADYIEELFRVC